MIAYLKQLLKKNRLTHTVGKHIRNYFVPHRRLGDLTWAWNHQFFRTDRPDLCRDLFKKTLDYQRALAAQKIKPDGLSKRYLGYQWLHDMGTLAHLDIYAKIGLLGWRPPQQSILVIKPDEVGNPFLLSLWKKHFDVLEDRAVQKKLAWEIPLLTEYYLFMEINNKILFSMTAAAMVQANGNGSNALRCSSWMPRRSRTAATRWPRSACRGTPGSSPCTCAKAAFAL